MNALTECPDPMNALTLGMVVHVVVRMVVRIKTARPPLHNLILVVRSALHNVRPEVGGAISALHNLFVVVRFFFDGFFL
jgi:hypothetical protein